MKTGRKEIFTRAPSELTNRQVGDTTKQQLPPPHASSCIYGSLAMASCLLKLKSSKQDCNLEWNSYWALQVSKEVTWNWISAEFPRWDLKNWSDPVILLNILYFFYVKEMFRYKLSLYLWNSRKATGFAAPLPKATLQTPQIAAYNLFTWIWDKRLHICQHHQYNLFSFFNTYVKAQTLQACQKR